MGETGAILGALVVQMVVALAELVSAHVANSHALTIAATLSAIDGATFVLALLPAWLRVHSSAHARASFGSDRAEVLVAFVSVSILIALCVSMSISAARSLFGDPEPVHGALVFFTASVALVGNFLMATILSCCGVSGNGAAGPGVGRPPPPPTDEEELQEMEVLRLHGPDRNDGAAGGGGGSGGSGGGGSGGGAADSMDGVALAAAGSNMNVAAVKAHLWADLGENVTVIAAGVIMVLRPAWRFVDPLFSLIVAAGVLISNAPLVREALYILCEWAPATVDVSLVADRVAATPGVAAVEQLRVWSISSTRVCATVHVALGPRADWDATVAAVRRTLRKEAGARDVFVDALPLDVFRKVRGADDVDEEYIEAGPEERVALSGWTALVETPNGAGSPATGEQPPDVSARGRALGDDW